MKASLDASLVSVVPPTRNVLLPPSKGAAQALLVGDFKSGPCTQEPERKIHVVSKARVLLQEQEQQISLICGTMF